VISRMPTPAASVTVGPNSDNIPWSRDQDPSSPPLPGAWRLVARPPSCTPRSSNNKRLIVRLIIKGAQSKQTIN
jgi:hypothetical protein